MPIDYQAARETLEAELAAVEQAVLQGQAPGCDDPAVQVFFDKVFASRTQAYREVLLGCILAAPRPCYRCSQALRGSRRLVLQRSNTRRACRESFSARQTNTFFPWPVPFHIQT